MLTSLFACPGSLLRERWRHRQAARQQRQAMREAQEAGWKLQDSDDDDDADVLENEHHHWNAPEATDVVKQYFESKEETSKEPRPSTSSFGNVPLFTPEYFEILTDSPTRTSPTATAHDSSDDEDEDPPENAPESALSPEVSVMLERMATTAIENSSTSSSSSSKEQQQPPAIEKEPTIVPTTSTLMSHFRNNDDEEEDHSDEDDDDSSDDQSEDSIDYGGAEVNMWKSVGTSFVSADPEEPPRQEETTVPPPLTSTDLLADQEEDEEEDDDDDIHQGNEVFLFKESQNHYAGVENNMLFDIQEAPAATTELLTQETTNVPSEPFSPRFFSDDEPSGVWEDLTFTPNGTYKSPNQLKLSQILSPDPNDVLPPPASSQPPSLMSPLSSMVHPMNLELFQYDNINDQSFSTIATETDHLSISSCPVRSDLIPRSSNDSVRTSASFRSSASKTRVRYSLTGGKKSMSKEQRVYSKAFLPKSLLPELAEKPCQKNKIQNHVLSVLLVHVEQHVFEVIAVDCFYKDDCTVGDVLSKARSSATDPALSEQKYVSLVCGRQEFAAPMLNIHVAVDFRKSQPLALAVPEGSTGTEMQAIQRVLWKNPKMKRWWNVEDPFQPINMEPIREIQVPSPKDPVDKKEPIPPSSEDSSVV